ncbi:hypothetical protein CSKR_203561 [Clonorchis sinensis]|uniref:Uncharacterized protein n=1 Tax=Clonorchis sinensis TaxID=79923 RepID=A0A8T1MCD2_CLOSI|nr:hypothetical protein CSKR_203561 [Clonorchis sinensis]
MDSNCFWSTPRRQNPSPFHMHTNVGNVALQTPGLIRSTAASVDSIQTHSPYNVSPANTKHPETRIGMGRPCLAGTQTAHHQANQHTTVTELPNISNFGDLTHDSSGFGSLLVDQSNNSNFTVYQKSAERTRISWPRQNLIHLESDTSDLGLGQSVLGEQHQVEPRIERTEYQYNQQHL